MAIAAGPYLSGFDSNTAWLWDDWSKPDLPGYWKSLTLGRTGVLPFACLLFVTVGLWAQRLYGPPVP